MTYDDNDGRDESGRWRKGFCPNPNGRPRKKPEISDADVHHFKNAMMTVTINGEQRHLSRHELLVHSMFEQAIKGKFVLIQRMLYGLFQDSEDLRRKAEMTYQRVAKQIVAKYKKSGEIDETLHEEYRELRYLLTDGGDPDRPTPKGRSRRVRRKPPAGPPWRKGPKPQSLLDLEKEEEAEWLAAKLKRERMHGPPIEYQFEKSDKDDEDGPVDF